MEPWIPQRPLQPRGRPPTPSQGPDRGFRRDGYHRPVPHSWHQGERFRHWQDIRGSSQPQQDPKADHQQPHYIPRPGEWHQPVAGMDYYEGGYHPHLYSRYGFRAWNWPNSPECLWTDGSCPSSFSFYFSSFPSPPLFSSSTLLHWCS